MRGVAGQDAAGGRGGEERATVRGEREGFSNPAREVRGGRITGMFEQACRGRRERGVSGKKREGFHNLQGDGRPTARRDDLWYRARTAAWWRGASAGRTQVLLIFLLCPTLFTEAHK